MLKRLQRDTVLSDPEKVERWAFDLQISNKTRSIFFDAYNNYCLANEIKWHKPILKLESYPVRARTEERINLIISAATKKYATIFQISKHGLRPDEISKITLRDLDLERGELSVKTSKLGLERTLKLQPETKNILRDYVHRYRIQGVNQKLFAESKMLKEKWRFYRIKAYDKLKDLELIACDAYSKRSDQLL